MKINKRISCFFVTLSLLVSYSLVAQSQLVIGDNSTVITSSAALEIASTTKGLLLPRMTLTERNAIVSPVPGLMLWCTDCGTGELQFYNGSSWYGMSTVRSGGSTILLPQSGGSAICDGSMTTVVVPITSTTGKVWMDRNLGASQAGTSATDYLAYGCLYQWGRGNDGHASIKWTAYNAGTPVNSTTDIPFSTDTPENALFVKGGILDWRQTVNVNLWQASAGQINNPCPNSYRVPTLAEFEAEKLTSGAIYGSLFKFVYAGHRDPFYGNITDVGVNGRYWTSTISGGVTSWYAGFNRGNDDNFRVNGVSVRCIKN